jgi:hypothetical protein
MPNPSPVGDANRSQPDLAALFGVLAHNAVEFVVVGGVAATVHGATRATTDLDVCPQWTTENLERLAHALGSIDARLRVDGADEPVEFPLDARALRAFEVSTWRTRHGDLDVIVGIPTESGALVGYDILSARSIEDRSLGSPVRIASLADVVESKERLGRPSDIEALPELRELARNTQDRA